MSTSARTPRRAGRNSTTAHGNAYRDEIAALFRTKYSNVCIEESLGGKCVDLTYREYRYGKLETIGIECKYYARVLGASDISKIWFEYSPLLSSGHLDCLIVVSPFQLGSVAQQRLKDMRGLRFRTHADLEEDLLGLRSYFETLSQLFSNGGLNAYYIDARFDDCQESAIGHIQTWINASDASPLAVLGGYGKGKTSLAKRVVTEQATKYLKDGRERMPILIRLGETTHETTLEGLFGREFTARYRTQDFHFETFLHLNRQGRLLVVLDGFDEMKHGMTVTDFKANFLQFNRLVEPKSRVLLLGRPNALPSEIRTQVLRGRRVVDDVEITAPGLKAWSEVAISSFNDSEIRTFLGQYLEHLVKTARPGASVLKAKAISARVEEIVEKVRFELLCRPVHAKIIAELAADPVFPLSGITEYKLYDEFLKQIVERDALEKPARKRISVANRLRFQEELAYWAWTRHGETQGAFYREEVPKSLLKELDGGATIDDEAKLNEYLVSTVTDEKEAGQLFFGHRSFQEFLVAQKLRRLTQNEVNHSALSKIIQPEIGVFLLGGPSSKFLEGWFESLPGFGSAVSLTYLSLFTHSQTILKDVRRRFSAQRATFPLIGIVGMCLDMETGILRKEVARDLLLECIRVGTSPLLAGFSLYLLLRGSMDAETAPRIVGAALLRYKDRMDKAQQAGRRAVWIGYGDDPSTELMMRHIKRRGSRRQETIQWNSARTRADLREYLMRSGRLLQDDYFSDASDVELQEGALTITKSQFEDASPGQDVVGALKQAFENR